jgi:hypothetical protein
MKKILINYIPLVLVAITLLSSGCKTTVSDGQQHINMQDTQKFIGREDRPVSHPNHEQWDADILRALNRTEFLLKQK